MDRLWWWVVYRQTCVFHWIYFYFFNWILQPYKIEAEEQYRSKTKRLRFFLYSEIFWKCTQLRKQEGWKLHSARKLVHGREICRGDIIDFTEHNWELTSQLEEFSFHANKLNLIKYLEIIVTSHRRTSSIRGSLSFPNIGNQQILSCLRHWMLHHQHHGSLLTATPPATATTNYKLPQLRSHSQSLRRKIHSNFPKRNISMTSSDDNIYLYQWHHNMTTNYIIGTSNFNNFKLSN